MRTSQLTIGFEMPINPEEIATLLTKHYGPVDIGMGIVENGLPTNCIYFHNKKKHGKQK